MEITKRKQRLNFKGFALGHPEIIAFVMAILLFIITIIINPQSLNVHAFGAILSLTIMLSIAGAGQTMVMISDGIDMSLGATMSMAGIVTAGIMKGREGFVLKSLFFCVAIGAIIGLVNGIGSVKIGLPPMIVTLCVANVVTRLQYVFTEGKPSGMAAPGFAKSMSFRLGGVVPSSIFYGIVFFIIVFYLLHHSRYGMQLFLTGNNMRAAYLSGIKTVQLKVLNYTIAGVLASLAGFLGAAYMGSNMNCGVFDSYTMQTIVAVVVGGTLMSGGKGSFVGTIAGALLITVLTNFLSIFNISSVVTDMVMGIILIFILTVYNRSKAIRQ